MSDRVAIVGGGPAGLSVARAYRDAGGSAPVTILAGEPHAPYQRPPLTKEYLRGELELAELPIEAEAFYAERKVELREGAGVAALDTQARTLTTDAGEEIAFGECVLATGSEPRRLPVAGGEDPDLVLVRTVESSDRLREVSGPDTRVLVIGSGFIGCEAAASMAARGASVVLVTDEDAPHAARLGEEVGTEIARWLEEAGVELRAGSGVEAIERTEAGGFAVALASGARVEADAAACAVGVEPNVALATDAGLDLERGGIAVDAAMATGVDGVRAVGDSACALNVAAGRRLRVEHWGDALTHGEVAGRALAGTDARWDSAPGFWSMIGERTLKYSAWGDGHDEIRVRRFDDGAFTAWYGLDGTCVGVLTHGRDEDYESGGELVRTGAPLP